MNARNIRFLQQAKKIANLSNERFKVGAIVTKGNRILGLGVNVNKTHPKSNGRFKTLHAEHSAILDAGLNELQGSTVYVFRSTKDTLPANSKPCPSCYKLLKEAGVKEVYFSLPEFPYYGVEVYA